MSAFRKGRWASVAARYMDPLPQFRIVKLAEAAGFLQRIGAAGLGGKDPRTMAAVITAPRTGSSRTSRSMRPGITARLIKPYGPSGWFSSFHTGNMSCMGGRYHLSNTFEPHSGQLIESAMSRCAVTCAAGRQERLRPHQGVAATVLRHQEFAGVGGTGAADRSAGGQRWPLSLS
jgi:hypothetical protein